MHATEIQNPRLRFAELSSTVGAGIAGIGIGALAATTLGGLGIAILIAGLVLHTWGMADKHAIENRAGEARPRWSSMLYSVCWIAIAGLVLAIAVRALG